MSFYLTLPSSSSASYFPENKAGHYFTQLPNPVELKEEYEVGLTEIQFTNSYINVKESECWISFKKNDKKNYKVKIYPGLFASNAAFVDHLAERCRIDRNLDVVYFLYDESTRQVTIRIRDEGVLNLSPTLSRLMGFKKTRFGGPREHVSSGVMDLNDDYHSFFIYCDIVQQTPVGDTLAPLLRIVPTWDKSRQITHSIFDKPFYIPVSRNQFNTIEILLKNHLGETVSFASGQTIVTLHFRPKDTK